MGLKPGKRKLGMYENRMPRTILASEPAKRKVEMEKLSHNSS
jgi:hypothetical protein